RAILHAAHERREPMPIEHAVQIAMGVLLGLHHAHERADLDGRPLRIVHRDVSPHNVVVTWDGAVKVVDFGIAKAENRAARPTVAGMLKGKCGYMSPEQCRGDALDGRSDVFSTGIVLYEMVAGRRLFGGPSDIEAMGAILHGTVPPLGEIA